MCESKATWPSCHISKPHGLKDDQWNLFESSFIFSTAIFDKQVGTAKKVMSIQMYTIDWQSAKQTKKPGFSAA